MSSRGSRKTKRTVAARGFILLLTIAAAVGCNSHSEPELALQTYVDAVRDGRCGDALDLLSERSRYALDVLRVKPQDRHNPLPVEEYYCRPLFFEDCKAGKMTVASQQAETATVTMPCGRTQDGILPGFPSIFLKYEPRENELVLENGEWHIVLPFVIRIVEVREKEDRMRDAAMREYERKMSERGISPAPKKSPSPVR